MDFPNTLVLHVLRHEGNCLVYVYLYDMYCILLMTCYNNANLSVLSIAGEFEKSDIQIAIRPSTFGE